MKTAIFSLMIGALLARPVYHGTSWLDFFAGQAEAQVTLPIDIGRYVRDDWPCPQNKAPDAVTVYYTGTGINAIARCDLISIDGINVEMSCVDPQSYPETRFAARYQIKVITRQQFDWLQDGQSSKFRWCGPR